jgi:hypothetical protein
MIRVHELSNSSRDIYSLSLIKELRRGYDHATIYDIQIYDNKWLSVLSDKGTLHVYSINNTIKNNRSNLALIKSILPNYFSSEWSLIKINIESQFYWTTG